MPRAKTNFRRAGEDNEAISYFQRILPRIKQDEASKPGGPPLGMREMMQYPGDTIFSPTIRRRHQHANTAASPLAIRCSSLLSFLSLSCCFSSRRLVACRVEPGGHHGGHAKFLLASTFMRSGAPPEQRESIWRDGGASSSTFTSHSSDSSRVTLIETMDSNSSFAIRRRRREQKERRKQVTAAHPLPPPPLPARRRPPPPHHHRRHRAVRVSRTVTPHRPAAAVGCRAASLAPLLRPPLHQLRRRRANAAQTQPRRAAMDMWQLNRRRRRGRKSRHRLEWTAWTTSNRHSRAAFLLLLALTLLFLLRCFLCTLFMPIHKSTIPCDFLAHSSPLPQRWIDRELELAFAPDS